MMNELKSDMQRYSNAYGLSSRLSFICRVSVQLNGDVPL